MVTKSIGVIMSDKTITGIILGLLTIFLVVVMTTIPSKGELQKRDAQIQRMTDYVNTKMVYAAKESTKVAESTQSDIELFRGQVNIQLDTIEQSLNNGVQIDKALLTAGEQLEQAFTEYKNKNNAALIMLALTNAQTSDRIKKLETEIDLLKKEVKAAKTQTVHHYRRLFPNMYFGPIHRR